MTKETEAMKLSEKPMTNLERELAELKSGIIEMMDLVSNQLERSEKAFTTQDVSIAKETHRFEKLVDGFDLRLDKQCESLIALYNPVASDLRFILASLKIISHLERVGDHADKISRYVRKGQIKEAYPKKLLENVRLAQMFDKALEMLEIATQAFIEEDSSLARQVFKLDEVMNQIYSEAISLMHKFAKKTDPRMDLLLYLFSVINKLERVGDMAKNIAEETIFYIEAKTLKHKKT